MNRLRFAVVLTAFAAVLWVAFSPGGIPTKGTWAAKSDRKQSSPIVECDRVTVRVILGELPLIEASEIIATLMRSDDDGEKSLEAMPSGTDAERGATLILSWIERISTLDDPNTSQVATRLPILRDEFRDLFGREWRSIY